MDTGGLNYLLTFFPPLSAAAEVGFSFPDFPALHPPES